MSSFTSPLLVSPESDGRNWTLKEPFDYHVGDKESDVKISVPIEFRTDFASLPTLATPALTIAAWALILLNLVTLGIILLSLICVFSWLRNWAKYNKAPVLHDWLYHSKQMMGTSITRKTADSIFLEAMLVDWRNHKERHFIARLEYWAVRLFAWPAWKIKK